MKKLSLLLFMFFVVVGMTVAQRTITGTVSDVGGETLIGANVLAKGSTLGTITDIDGSFSLSVPDGTTTLVISYTGYETMEVDISSQSNVSVTMAEGQLLDEIVVTAGGLERNKARLGYAIQNVDSEDLLAAKEVNLVDALNSKVAGVNVTSSSGSPGSSSNIRIRGSVSINGSNSPLFVIDGIPIDNSSVGNGTDGVDNSNRAIDINPNDIADLTVLKGPSATALYGVRAANGAIVITTKKGKKGAPRVNITTSYSIDQANKFPERQSEWAQGRLAGGEWEYRDPSTTEGDSWGPRISDLRYIDIDKYNAANPDNLYSYDYDRSGELVAADSEFASDRAGVAYDPYDFFRNGNSYNLSASVSGGTDMINYFISADQLNSTGIVPNATFERNSFRVNLGSDVTEKFNVGMNMNYVQSGGNRIQRGSNLQGVMLGLLRNPASFDIGNGLTGQAGADDVSSYIRESDGGQRSYRAGIYDNPYWTVNKNPSKDDVNRIIGSAYAGYKILDNLSVGYRIGIDNYSDRRNSAFDINPGRGAGEVTQGVVTNRDINSDIFMNYDTYLTDDLSITATVGYNQYDHRYISQFTTGSTLAAPNFYHISNATDLVASETILTKKLSGLYGTVDFGFRDFAFVNVTARNDWSSILPTDANTFASYSASVGLELTEMLNLNSSFLDYAKLRLSYGKVGNDGGDAFIYASANNFNSAEAGGDGFITTVDFPAFGTNAFERSELLGNAALRPESTKTVEFGTELKFLKGRVGLDVNYFSSRSEDQIIAVNLSATTGFTNSVQNVGLITNKGWEVTASGTPVRTRDFSWDIDVNYTQIENVVEELTEGVEEIFLAGFTSTSARAVVGQPFSALYGTGFQRNDEGRVIIGENGFPMAEATPKALGDPNPDFTVGINNKFTYKGVSVSALFDIRQGGDVWCGTCGIMDFFGTSAKSGDQREDIVVFDGVKQIGISGEGTPIYTENDIAVGLADTNKAEGDIYWRRYGFGGIGEMSIYDASWVRLRQVSLGYTLPSSLFENNFIGGAELTLTGRNLWLSTKYPGVDPETNLTGDSNGFGLDYFNMPNTKSYSATLRLSF